MQSLEVESPTSVYGWQLKWKAKTFVCCRGLLFMGPIKYSIAYLHVVFIFLYWQIYNDTIKEQLEASSHIFTYYLLDIYKYIALFFFIWAAFTDPGVLMRNQNYDHITLNKELISLNTAAKEIKKRNKVIGGSHTHNHGHGANSQAVNNRNSVAVDDDDDDEEEDTNNPQVQHAVDMIDEESKDEEDQLNLPKIYTKRFCSTCNIQRPPLASHCAVCDQCVINFDHHCFVTNSCVGARNFQPFIFMIIMVAAGQVLIVYNYFIYAWQLTYDLSISEDDSEIYLIQIGIMLIFCFFQMGKQNNVLFLIFLSIFSYHIYFINELFASKDPWKYYVPASVLFTSYIYFNWCFYMLSRYYFLIQFQQTMKERRQLMNPSRNSMVPKPMNQQKKTQNLIKFFTNFVVQQSEFRRRMNVAGVRKSGKGGIQGYYNVNDSSTVTE